MMASALAALRSPVIGPWKRYARPAKPAMASFEGAPTIRSSAPSPLTSPAGATCQPKSSSAPSPVIVASGAGRVWACAFDPPGSEARTDQHRNAVILARLVAIIPTSLPMILSDESVGQVQTAYRPMGADSYPLWIVIAPKCRAQWRRASQARKRRLRLA